MASVTCNFACLNFAVPYYFSIGNKVLHVGLSILVTVSSHTANGELNNNSRTSGMEY